MFPFSPVYGARPALGRVKKNHVRARAREFASDFQLSGKGFDTALVVLRIKSGGCNALLPRLISAIFARRLCALLCGVFLHHDLPYQNGAASSSAISLKTACLLLPSQP